jgi:hypothetical protein
MREALKRAVKAMPLLGPAARAAAARLRRLRFGGSPAYWEARYARGETSGAGSYGRLAAFKAEFLNAFVARHAIRSVIEWGCGDGAQLAPARYPRYVGLDVSPTAVRSCIARFAADPTKSFFLYDPTCFADRQGLFAADLALSLDVVYHLVEDAVFERYMGLLFDSARRHVIVYSSDRDEAAETAHVRHRRFTNWVVANRPGWRLTARVPNRYPEGEPGGSFADFHVFEPVSDVSSGGS